MTYAATWINANAQGRLEGGVHRVKLSDAMEIETALARRSLLTYRTPEDFSEELQGGAFVSIETFAPTASDPTDNFRYIVTDRLVSPATGSMGGSPPTPEAMAWLWPEQDSDEGKIIVTGTGGVQEGQVGLFQKLNGTSDWTDVDLLAGQDHIRAVHVNELRQSVEWMRRGRWELPIYFSAGIFSVLPETPWIGEAIANNGMNELRSLGFAILRTGEEPAKGLTNVTVRPGSFIELTADSDCEVGVYRCLRPLDFDQDLPTWNEYAPGASLTWSVPGASGADDAEFIGSTTLTAGTAGTLSGSSVTNALQTMIDGAEQNFLVQRSDTGTETIGITGRAIVEFDLDSPPN